MAQERLTDRTALNETPNDSDLIHIVDVSDTTDNANGTSKKITIANLLGGITAVGTQPVENEYADITALLADQGNQTTTYFQYVLDASADPNVASGDAYYEKLSGSTGTLATDYRLLSDTETQIITDSNGYRVFRIQYIQDDSSPNDTATGGRIGFNYDTGTDKVTSVVFNQIYSDALDIFYAQRASNTYKLKFYNRNTGVYSFATVTGWTVNGNYYIVDTDAGIDVSEISVNNRIELFFEIDNSGSSSPLTTKGDVYTYSTVDARLPVGTDGQVLTADSSEATGLKWGYIPNNTVVNESVGYNVTQTILPFEASNGAISDGFLYLGIGTTFVKYSPSTGSETLLTVAGTTEWRCAFVHSSGRIFFSPMDSPSATITASEHGLYMYDPVADTTTQEIVLTTQECIWGIDEDSNGNIYAGVYSFPTDNGDIYKSTDNGDNWSVVYSPTYDSTGLSNNHTHAVFVDRSNDYVYICGGDEYGGALNYVSTDGGSSFSEILGSIGNDNQYTSGIAVDGARLFGTDVLGIGQIHRTTNDTSVSIVLDAHYQNFFWMRQSDITGWVYAGAKLDPSATVNLRAEIYISKDLGLTWDLYTTIAEQTAGDGFWFASQFVNGQMIVGLENGGSFDNAIVITETTQNVGSFPNPVPISRTLTEFDHKRNLEVLDDITLTIPETGLQDNFECNIDVISGSCVVEAENANITLDSPNGNILNLNSTSWLYRRYGLNTYRLKSNDATTLTLLTNLVAAYDLTSDSTDSVGSLDGTDTNMTYSGYADFNGTNGYIEFPDDDVFSVTDGVSDIPYSFEAWVYFDVADEGYIINKQNNSAQCEFIIAYAGGNLTCIFQKNNNAAVNIRANYAWSPSTATWYHIVATYNGSESESGIKIYLDGSLLSTTNIINGAYTGTTNGTSTVGLGRNHQTNAVYLDGRMKYVRFWKNRELQALDVTNLYNSGSGLPYASL